MLSIEYLCNINEKFCMVSILRDSSNLNIINYYYQVALNDKDNFLCSAFKIACLIKLYQPFCDGNHRTSLVVLNDLLNLKRYKFDLDTALDDIENHTLHLPLLFTHDEVIDDISDYEKYIISRPQTKRLI